MKVLVTGAAGFIGSHTCERLIAGGHEVVGFDSFDGFLYPSEPKRDNAAALIESLPAERFELIEGDVADREAVTHVLARGGFDVVCHLAALAGVRPSLRDPVRYVRTNVQGTTVVLEAMRSVGLDRLVFASSSSVYGVRAAEGEPLDAVGAFREDDPCLAPASPYAATKRAGELVCSTYRDLFGIGVSCLRYFTVYGPRQRPDMAISKFVTAVAAGEEIVVYGDGSSRRDYTFIDDIVSGTVAAIERAEAGRFEIYNLGGTRTVSLSDLVSAIERTVGKPAIIDRQPMQPGDVPVTFADITNSARDLGYAPTTALEDGLVRYWDWYRARAPLGD